MLAERERTLETFRTSLGRASLPAKHSAYFSRSELKFAVLSGFDKRLHASEFTQSMDYSHS